MEKLYALRDMLCEELKKFGDKDKIDMSTLESVDKLTHAIKNLDKIIDRGEGYSEMMPPRMMYDGMSYGRGRNARRDSMGHYSRNAGGYPNTYRGDYQELMQDMPMMGRM